MRSSQIRAELLEQHAELRGMVERARQCAERTRDGAPLARDDLASMIRRLSNAMQSHNVCEEELLWAVIPTIDAWGQARAEILTDEHGREYEDLHRALVGILSTPPEVAADAMGPLLDDLLERMDREEQACLDDRVLRDDVVMTDAFSG